MHELLPKGHAWLETRTIKASDGLKYVEFYVPSYSLVGLVSSGRRKKSIDKYLAK